MHNKHMRIHTYTTQMSWFSSCKMLFCRFKNQYIRCCAFDLGEITLAPNFIFGDNEKTREEIVNCNDDNRR